MTILLALVLMGQGCINEGPDHRLLGWIICPLQRVLSLPIHIPPAWLLRHRDQEQNVRFGITFPPYVIVQKPNDQQKWVRFRLGWHYDVNWRGYIFPAGEFKRNQEGPLPKGY